MADPLGDGFDLVTGTPPYLRIGEGVESGRPQLAPCHFEHRGGLEAYCQAASRIVAPGGTLVLCAGAAQHQRMLDAAHAAGFAVASWLPVVPRQGKTPLFSVYAMRQSDGRAQSHPPLVVRDAAGRRTPPFLRVRRDMGMPP